MFHSSSKYNPILFLLSLTNTYKRDRNYLISNSEGFSGGATKLWEVSGLKENWKFSATPKTGSLLPASCLMLAHRKQREILFSTAVALVGGQGLCASPWVCSAEGHLVIKWMSNVP